MNLAERFKKELKIQNIFETKKTVTKSTSDLKGCYEDLKQKTLAKIKHTPYWEDYSLKAKEKMISKYYERKISDTEYSAESKSKFVNEILNCA